MRTFRRMNAYLFIPELPQYSIRAGDVVLEVEQENVAGYTSSDVQTLFDYCSNLNRPIELTLIHSGEFVVDIQCDCVVRSVIG